MCGLMWRKSRDNVACASSASAPAISTPVGPAPTRTKVKRALAYCRVRHGFRLFEGEQHAAADQGGIV
jgi:hypothetical protein